MSQGDQVSAAFAELMNSQIEFPLNVEGVKVLPHMSTVVSFDMATMQAVLKMLRPLPAQLPLDTPCIVSIGALGEHWKARLIFKSRAGHLQYQFDLPNTMEKTGRREHKRYPFRPRENIQVYVQDASLPGTSAVGYLVDLSVGGLAFVPERAFRNTDGARLRMDTALFEKGKSFPLMRIDGLPRLDEPVKLRGVVAHVAEKGTGLFVAIVFGILEPGVAEILAKVLESREKTDTPGGGGGSGGYSSSSSSSSSSTQQTSDKAAANNTAPEAAKPQQTENNTAEPIRVNHNIPPHLMRLSRRTCNLLLVKPAGNQRDEVIKTLKEAGYVRIEQCEELDSHVVKTMPDSDVLLVALENGGNLEEPLQSFRILHEHLKSQKSRLTVVVAERFDQILLHASEELAMPIAFTTDTQWMEVLDNELL